MDKWVDEVTDEGISTSIVGQDYRRAIKHFLTVGRSMIETQLGHTFNPANLPLLLEAFSTSSFAVALRDGTQTEVWDERPACRVRLAAAMTLQCIFGR